MMDRARPVGTGDETDRTVRGGQVTGCGFHPDSRSQELNRGFGTDGGPSENIPDGHDNDFA